LSYDEWRQQFIDWVRRPEPTALLNASIFFDLQPLFGQLELGEKLRTLLLSMTTDTPSFLHLMAANALQADVPLNFRGEVVAEKGEFSSMQHGFLHWRLEDDQFTPEIA
jgi:CBS domain-containing protein